MKTDQDWFYYQGSLHQQIVDARNALRAIRAHAPKPRMRQIGDVWMCYSKTHAAVEPRQEDAYQRWEGML